MAGPFARSAALLFALSCASGLRPAPAQGTQVAPDAGCVQHKGSYVCNWSSFKLAFDRAHTVAIETGSMDRSTANQLNRLVGDLGKTRAEGQAADLVMLLIPVDPAGLDMGPMDHDLATLRIYAPSAGSPHGTLLWAETFRGQGDRPWPAQVHALISQFQAHFAQR